MKVGTAEQKGFLKGEDTSVICSTRLKGKQKESVASQPSLQQVACRLPPHQSSEESQLNAMKWNKIGWSIVAWQCVKSGRSFLNPPGICSSDLQGKLCSQTC